ncbi:hypothetical protein JY651_10890 [Pyxidicoccus parkwayensis]|uniref:SRPBCC family protein n=1 Tax=Pyxidicoccus parkwayensis TaxID=2813578 RepID=A0ABX7P4I9_9BACT|nr:hypothetical protein [Pyxidicoccus parkwaysis]QSQ25393.1 hypothetical protein JY651_10890 [Pyxidicoccus parkwaysis]
MEKTTQPPTPRPPHPPLEKPTSLLGPALGMGVTMGPSLVLDLLWASAVTATLLGGRSRGRAFQAASRVGALMPWGWLLVRPWMLCWGATPEEVRRALPGDALVPNPVGGSTRAVTIDAPPEAVWPWLVQMGYRRAGWYSYDWLEQTAGAGGFVEGHSADHVLPHLQGLQVGDVIPMSRWTGMQVMELVPSRVLVLSSAVDEEAPAWGLSSWAFVLEPVAGGRTRLLVRGRSGMEPRRWMQRALAQLIELPHFVMERRMMLGLKARAERAAHALGAATWT